MSNELRAIVELLKKPEPTPDFSRIFTNFTTGKNHAVVKWDIADNDAVVKQIWGDFKGLTSYEAESCIGVSIYNFVDESTRPLVGTYIDHALRDGFVAKKTAIYTAEGEVKYISGILYRHDQNTLIELLFNPIGIEL